MPTIILALDIATKCGFAYDHPDKAGVPISGTFRAPGTIRGDDGGFDMGASFLAFEVWLRSKITETNATHLVYEAPLPTVSRSSAAATFHTSDQTIRLAHGFQAHAESSAQAAGIPCFEKSVASVKKYFTGDGRATKQQMMMRARQLGWEFVDDNACDAMALWGLSHSLLEPRWQPAAFALFMDRAKR